MKISISVMMAILIIANAKGQYKNHVKFDFRVEKIKQNKYKIHIVASLEDNWHIYSQKQPKNAVAQPTVISWNNNEAVRFLGTVQEFGKRELFEDRTVNISAVEYSEQVDFVQTLVLKNSNAKMINGQIKYMVCDKICMPPITVPISISIP